MTDETEAGARSDEYYVLDGEVADLNELLRALGSGMELVVDDFGIRVQEHVESDEQKAAREALANYEPQARPRPWICELAEDRIVEKDPPLPITERISAPVTNKHAQAHKSGSAYSGE